MERAIRKTKRRLVAKKAILDAATGADRDKAQAEYNALSDKLTAQNKAYNDFCKANGLTPQYDRTRLADFTREQSDSANAAMKESELTNRQNRDIIKQRVESGEYSLTLSKQQYLKHVQGTPQYEAYEKARLAQSRSSQSKLYISEAEAQEFILSHYATGTPKVARSDEVTNIEFVDANSVIGAYCKDGKWYDTKRVAIHYGKKGSHIVPVEEI